MELKFKKRITGILLLIGLGLIFIPLFFGRSAPADEMQLSGNIPKPPTQPDNLTLAIPPAATTLPAAVSPSPPVATVKAENSQVVFEQVPPVTPVQQTTTPKAVPIAAPTAAVIAPTKHQTANSVNTVAATSTTNNSQQATATQSASPKAAPATANAHPSATTKPSHKTKTATAPAATAWVVQMGVFSDKINAEKLMTKLQAKGFAAYTHLVKTTQGDRIKVLVGPELRRSDAAAKQLKIEQAFNLKGMVVKTDI